jgi:hypothetical protein
MKTRLFRRKSVVSPKRFSVSHSDLRYRLRFWAGRLGREQAPPVRRGYLEVVLKIAGRAPDATKVSGAGSTFRRSRRAWRLGQAAANAIVGRRALGPFVHFPAHLPELVSQLAEPGSNLFFCGTVGHGGVVYRYVFGAVRAPRETKHV